MAIREIKIYGDPILREKSEPVVNFNEELKELVNDMIETMFEAPGVGLSAVQIGVLKRVVVIDKEPLNREVKEALVFINPKIISYSKDTVVMQEGCLSIPEYYDKVNRPKFIKVEAYDLKGNKFVYEPDEIKSRILQHEIDHLDGILFIDRINLVRRELVKRKLLRKYKNYSRA